MNNDPIIYMATLNSVTRAVEAQVRPTEMDMEGYAVILSIMVRATVNLFVDTGIPEKEVLDTILKKMTREARKPSNSATYSQTRAQ